MAYLLAEFADRRVTVVKRFISNATPSGCNDTPIIETRSRQPKEKTMLRSNKLLYILFAFIVCFTSIPMFAQEIRGSFQGLISDQQGAAVPGASITATNTATNVVTTTKADVTGNYSIPFLPPGPYRVSVEATGFSTSVNPDVVLGALGDTAA